MVPAATLRRRSRGPPHLEVPLNGPVPTRIIHRDDALVWAVDGDTDSARLPEPRDGDHCYTVTISGVQVDGTTPQAPYEYAVCILADDS